MSKNSVYNGSLTGNKPTNIIQGTISEFKTLVVGSWLHTDGL